MKMKNSSLIWVALSGALIVGVGGLLAQDQKQISSYMPVDIHESFSVIFSRMTAAKPEVIKRHSDLLEQRYDLSDHPAKGITMSRNKPLQQGIRVKLPAGVTWDQLAKMTRSRSRTRGFSRLVSSLSRTRITPKAAWCFRSLKSMK